MIPSMIYNHHNAQGADVYNVDTKEKIGSVMEVHLARREVTCALQPPRVDHYGALETQKIKFRSIYPIFGGGLYLVLFHCYGRLA